MGDITKVYACTLTVSDHGTPIKPQADGMMRIVGGELRFQQRGI